MFVVCFFVHAFSFLVYPLLLVVGCVLFVVRRRCSLFVVRRLLCYVPYVVCCVMLAERGLMSVVCRCSLFVGCCSLFAVCSCLRLLCAG